MHFFFPDKIAGISIDNFTKWIIFDIDGLEPQEIKNNQYSLSNIITQNESVDWQLQLKYGETILFKSIVNTLYFEESLIKDVIIKLDDLSILNQLKIQIEELERKINTAESNRETTFEESITNMNKIIENLKYSIEEYNTNAEEKILNLEQLSKDEQEKITTLLNKRIKDLNFKVNINTGHLEANLEE